MRSRPFFAARIEDRLNRWLNRYQRHRGWNEVVVPFTGYGSSSHVRILARLVLRPNATRRMHGVRDLAHRRGWRNFVDAPFVDGQVTLHIGDRQIPLQADRGGYIDALVKNPGLAPGWHKVQLETPGGGIGIADVQVVSDDETFGIISDIDDTILSTWLPRPLLAAWNSFVLTEQARQAVPGMARLYQQLLAEHPGAPVIYVSTGSWNTFPFVNRFIRRHGIPSGAMLLTDWGPTNTGWFREGAQHKRTSLRELARDLPNIKWVLVGDDGQHDPELYAEFASLQPQHVRARAIRELSSVQQAMARGIIPAGEHEWQPPAAPEVRAPDGDGLADKLREVL